MTKKQLLLLVLAAFVIFAVDYFFQPGTPPPGQQPVLSLSSGNFAAFQQAFDEDPATPHLLLLLSPT